MSLFLAILPLGLPALVSPLQTNSGFLARLLQFLFLNRKLSGLGATSILLTMISNVCTKVARSIAYGNSIQVVRNEEIMVEEASIVSITEE